MDIFVESSEVKCGKNIRSSQKLLGFGYRVYKRRFYKEDNVIMMGRLPFRIDILTSINGVTFDEAYRSSKIYNDEGVEIRCIGIEELIINKKSKWQTTGFSGRENA